MQNLAPITLFAFNRLSSTRQTVEALAKNEGAKSSVLYVFCDGPKVDFSIEKRQQIEAVRQYLHREVKDKNLFAETILIERTENWGLGKSIIAGVTEIINKHGQVIVLEDDLVTSPYFLQFMNDSLSLYKLQTEVLTIGACNYFANDDSTKPTFFSVVPDCLGWATWSDRWALFEENGQKLLSEIENRGLMHRFNLEGSFNFEKMLKRQIEGTVSSWAVRWFAVSLLNDKLNLYPNPALTNHIGGEGATHATETIMPPLAQYQILVETIPLSIDPIIHKKLRKAYAKQQGFLAKLKKKIAKYFLNI
jgi:hypothetical protein